MSALRIGRFGSAAGGRRIVAAFAAIATFDCSQRPVHKAAASGNLGEMGALLEKRPGQVNVRDKSRNMPLHHAGEHGHADMVKLLFRPHSALGYRPPAPEAFEAESVGLGLKEKRECL